MARIFFSFNLNIFNQTYASSLPKVIIKSCYYGDIYTLTKGEKIIRLACIDTPRLKGPKAKSIEAKESKYFLNNLVAYKHISLKKITKDRYGRTVGEFLNTD